MKPHKHAEVIKAWADGAEIEFRGDHHKEWMPALSPSWADYNEYRIKPVEPERVYPQTAMTNNELKVFAHRAGTTCVDDCRDAANAALRRAVDSGQVLPAEGALKLNTIIGYAYQLAGAVGAPSYVLDVLSRPECVTMDQAEALNWQPADRAGRDMAIAEAVQQAFVDRFNRAGFYCSGMPVKVSCDLNLHTIIEQVQA